MTREQDLAEQLKDLEEAMSSQAEESVESAEMSDSLAKVNEVDNESENKEVST